VHAFRYSSGPDPASVYPTMSSPESERAHAGDGELDRDLLRAAMPNDLRISRSVFWWKSDGSGYTDRYVRAPRHWGRRKDNFVVARPSHVTEEGTLVV